MEGLKSFINTVVFLFKFLIWTIIVFYCFMGIWKLIHGNPKMTEENEFKEMEFAAMSLFLTVILMPGIYVGFYLFLDEPYPIPIETSADYVAIYVVSLLFVCVVGFVNNLVAEE